MKDRGQGAYGARLQEQQSEEQKGFKDSRIQKRRVQGFEDSRIQVKMMKIHRIPGARIQKSRVRGFKGARGRVQKSEVQKCKKGSRIRVKKFNQRISQSLASVFFIISFTFLPRSPQRLSALRLLPHIGADQWI